MCLYHLSEPAVLVPHQPVLLLIQADPPPVNSLGTPSTLDPSRALPVSDSCSAVVAVLVLAVPVASLSRRLPYNPFAYGLPDGIPNILMAFYTGRTVPAVPVAGNF